MSNGRDFFRRKRITPSASCFFSGRVSKSSRTTRTTESGSTMVTSRLCPPTVESTSSTTRRSSSGRTTLSPVRPGTTAPEESERALAESMPCDEPRAAITREGVISQASGRITLLRCFAICLLTRGLDEGDLVDLLQRGYAAAHAFQGLLAQEGHPLLTRGLANLRTGFFSKNHLADVIRQFQ